MKVTDRRDQDQLQVIESWTLRGNHKKEDFQVQLQNVHSTVQCT